MDEGRTLVGQGILAQEQDVFYFTLNELIALAENHFSGDVQEVIAAREKQYEQYRKLTPSSSDD